MLRTTCLLCMLLSGIGASAQVGGGFPDLSTVEMPGVPTGEAVLMVLPDGSGPDFGGARNISADLDATVVLYLVDLAYGTPVSGFPGEDIALAPFSDTGTFRSCSADGGLLADRDTDIDGVTLWNAPPEAGGWTNDLLAVYVRGDALTSNAGLPLRFNSPDIDGNGLIDLTDAGFMNLDSRGTYHFRSDLHYDGVINLSDLGAMMTHLGARCP